MPRDNDSVVTVSFDHEQEGSGGKQLSQAKLDQLAAAREKALLARRKKQKSALEAKLNELRHILGRDLRNDTVEHFAHAMMKQEQRLRDKQNALTESMTEALQSVKDELRSLRKMQMGPTARPDTRAAPSKPTPRTLSEVSAVSSRSLKLDSR